MPRPRFSGVYVIRNKVTLRAYVGASIDTVQRMQAHRTTLLRGVHQNALQRDWDKYGPDSFEWAMVETVRDLSQLGRAEIRWQAKFKRRAGLYNSTGGGDRQHHKNWTQRSSGVTAEEIMRDEPLRH